MASVVFSPPHTLPTRDPIDKYIVAAVRTFFYLVTSLCVEDVVLDDLYSDNDESLQRRARARGGCQIIHSPSHSAVIAT